MEARPVPARGTVLLFGAFFVLSAVVSFDAAGAAPVVVVGSIKCLDYSPDDASAEDAFKGMCNCYFTSGLLTKQQFLV
jgi:hypothetical protein